MPYNDDDDAGMRKIINDGAAAASKMTFRVLCLYSYLVRDDGDDDDNDDNDDVQVCGRSLALFSP